VEQGGDCQGGDPPHGGHSAGRGLAHLLQIVFKIFVQSVFMFTEMKKFSLLLKKFCSLFCAFKMMMEK
jgi:hypothetical protein